MKTETLEKSIFEVLPTVPFIVDQVGAAMNWVKEEVSEGEYQKILSATLKVAEYAARVSTLNFYKTHLVVGCLLSEIPKAAEQEKFKIFDTASRSVENTIDKITVDDKVSQEKGSFKALNIHMVPLARENQECLVVMLYKMLTDLEEIVSGMAEVETKSPITREDYVMILGYTWTTSVLYNSNLSLTPDTLSVLNEIQVILNSLSY